MFDRVIWVFVFCLNIICGIRNKPIMVGFSLLGLSFCVFLLIVTKYKLWYGLIFFLIYVGAVLVLVFYVVCLSANPIKNVFKAGQFIFGLVFILIALFFIGSLSSIKLKFLKGKYSYSLILIKENLTQVVLFYILFFLLWFIRKFTYLSVGSVRGFV